MAHLEDPRVEDPRAIARRAAEAGVTDVINASFSPDRPLSVEIDALRVHRCTGLHPLAIDSERWEAQLDAVTDALPNCIALGEIGLDEREDAPPLERQRDVFERQLAIARIQEKPIIVHCVGAWGAVIESLERFWPLGGIVHGYSGAPELLQRFGRVGLVPSFGGAITREHFKKARASAIEAKRFCIESDTPDHPPEGWESGEPAALPRIVEVLAALRGCEEDEVRDSSIRVAREVFGISSSD